MASTISVGQVRNDQHQCGGNIHGDAAAFPWERLPHDVIMQPVAEIQLAVGIAGAPGIIDQRLARLQRHGFAGPGIVVLLRDKVEIADFALGRIETAAFVRTGKITAAPGRCASWRRRPRPGGKSC